MKLFATLFTALSLIVPTAYAHTNPTLIAKAPYTSSEIIRIADTCEVGKNEADLKEVFTGASFEVIATVDVVGDRFTRLAAIFNELGAGDPPAGVVSFRIYMLANPDGRTGAYVTARYENGCSPGGIFLPLQLFNEIWQKLEGRPA